MRFTLGGSGTMKRLKIRLSIRGHFLMKANTSGSHAKCKQKVNGRWFLRWFGLCL